jgi:hypothetical protein
MSAASEPEVEEIIVTYEEPVVISPELDAVDDLV